MCWFSSSNLCWCWVAVKVKGCFNWEAAVLKMEIKCQPIFWNTLYVRCGVFYLEEILSGSSAIALLHPEASSRRIILWPENRPNVPDSSSFGTTLRQTLPAESFVMKKQTKNWKWARKTHNLNKLFFSSKSRKTTGTVLKWLPRLCLQTKTYFWKCSWILNQGLMPDFQTCNFLFQAVASSPFI